jgi:sulfite exporter TauE/SafE
VPATATPRSTSRAADLAPLGWFLGGKLVSHALLGTLLGLLGEGVQISFRTRAGLQIVAGVVMVVLALDLYGVRGMARLVPQPPVALARLVRRGARTGTCAAPALVGMATVLIPCGVTLSVEVLAVTSGAPLAGGAIMAVFVLGTSPLFAVLGYAVRRSASALRGRLGRLAALAVFVLGLISINTGLVLAGSPVHASAAITVIRGPEQNA